MGRRGPPKDQFNIRLPKEVIAHVDLKNRRGGPERAIRVLAGLIAYEWGGSGLRETLSDWAMRVARGEVSWMQVLDMIEERPSPRLNPKVLDQALEELAKQVPSGAAKRHRA